MDHRSTHPRDTQGRYTLPELKQRRQAQTDARERRKQRIVNALCIVAILLLLGLAGALERVQF